MGGFPQTPPDIVNLASQLLTVGEETIPRADINNVRTLTSTLVFGSYFTARKSESISQVRVNSITGAGATPTLIRIGWWTASLAGDLLSLVASTPNDITLLAANNTDYTKAFSAPFNKVAGQRYGVGILVVTAASLPTISSHQAVGAGQEQAQSPRINFAANSVANDLPSSVAATSLIGVASSPYFALLP